MESGCSGMRAAGVDAVQLTKIFLKYSNEHPELGHMPFGMTAINALVKAFPFFPVKSDTK